MAKKPRTMFAESNDGKLYVKLAAIMHPLCAFADGLPLTFFGKGKTAYLDIDTAIEWCRNEAKCHSADEYRMKIEVMERLKREFIPTVPQ